MDSGLSPKEQVELMLKRARSIEQMKEEIAEEVPEILVKEEEIKRVAKDWKDKITEKVYQALINYKVEIDD